MISLNDRQSHLKAMGVHQWYARTVLPGSQPTPEWVLLEPGELTPKTEESLQGLPLEQGVAPLSDKPHPGTGSGSSKSAMDILKQGGLSKVVDQPARLNEKAPQNSKVASVENIPCLSQARALETFSLVLYKTSKGLVISESASGQSHPAELQLLKNILCSKSSLSLINQGCQFHQVFNWPVFRSLNLQSKQDTELRELLSAWFFENYDSSIENVLYFGAYFTDITRFYVELVASLESSPVFHCFSHSLADLIQFPQRKADLWGEICSLYDV
jgi:hypothetical protein